MNQKRIAEINNGIVNSIIEAGEGTNYDPEKLLSVPGYAEAPVEVEPGWTYQDGQFAPPPEPEPPTLDEAKAAKLAEIANARWLVETGGVEIGDMTMVTDRDSQALITGAALQATIDPTYSCRWKTGNGFVEFNAQTFLAVATAVRQHVQACFDREADLAAQVEAAETVEEVQAIVWEL